MIRRDHPELSIARQCALLDVPRSTFYAPAPQGTREGDAELMEVIDHLFTAHPHLGSRGMRLLLRRLGYPVGRRRVRRLMGLMGLEPIGPKPNTSKPHPEHRVFPYRLRNLAVVRPNQVWATDITYIPMPKGFLYLVAIMDWYSRRVLAWKVSNTLEASFCVAALNEALAKYGAPEIFNTDQGAQFTSEAFLSVLEDKHITISMDGRGRALDNVFVERLWRSVKYECVYPKAFADGHALNRGLAEYFTWYNAHRPHQGLDGATPDEVYFADRSLQEAA